jgi:hypothetical protein
MLISSSISKILIWLFLIIVFIISGCSHTSELYREESPDLKEPVDYSIIYYIHADSDYLYHDATGTPVRGNSKVLDTAISVAEEAKSGEVFIFYQPAENRFLGLFPRKSSRFYHYINGELTSHIKYRHSDKSENFLTTEALLYNQYRTSSDEKNRRNYFLYYGHEIPDNDGIKYHQTLPEIEVNTGAFSKGIQKFLAIDELRFDLVVLSTCNNGTPVMVQNLMPFSDILLASPKNLHLSHINSESMYLLEDDPEISSLELADSIADQTYHRLESEILTSITITLYNFKMMREQINEIHAFSTSYNRLEDKQYFSDNIDCNQFEFFDNGVFKKGLKTWYKPARFGKRPNTSSHSGWGCKPIIDQSYPRVNS